jgi:hypothetical protein
MLDYRLVEVPPAMFYGTIIHVSLHCVTIG